MLNLLHKQENYDLGQRTTIWMTPLEGIEDNPYQTRQHNDPDHILNLAASIVQMARSLPDTKGLQQLPVGRLVRYDDGQAVAWSVYEDEELVRDLLAGGEHVVELAFGHSRRLAFFVLAHGIKHVFPELDGAEQNALSDAEYDAADYQAMPVLLRPLSDQEMWSHAITENAQRRDLTAIEEAIAIENARKSFDMTYDQAGKLFGKSRSAAANLVRLLQLPNEYQQAILDGRLTERHGRALLKLLPYPDAFASWPVATVADYNVNYLDKSIESIVATREMQRAEQTRPHARRLTIDELVKLVTDWMKTGWTRDLRDNPSHTNGAFWQDLTRWMYTNIDDTWTEPDLKIAIKQATANSQRSDAAAPITQTTIQQPASTEMSTSQDQWRSALAGRGQTELTELKAEVNADGTDEELSWDLAPWLRDAGWQQFRRPDGTTAAVHPVHGELVDWRCGGLTAMHRQMVALADPTEQGNLDDADDRISQSPAQQELAVVDTLRLIEWQAMFNEAVTALGEWATECGHRIEAGAAARALRAVVGRIERDLLNK